MARPTVRSTRQDLAEHQIAVANLALLEYISVNVRLEGTFVSTLQLLFGGVAILAGAFAYLSVREIPDTGRVIAVVSLQPGAILLTTLTGWALVFGRERSRQGPSISYGKMLAPGEGLLTVVNEVEGLLKDARSTLAARQSSLRLALLAGGGWFVASLPMVYVGNHWWPNLLNSIAQRQFPVAFLSLVPLGLMAVFTGISTLRRWWILRR